MKIHTKYLGEVEIEDSMVIHFFGGIPGFLEETEFVLLDLPDNPVFQILQSVKSVNMAFIVTNPYHIYQDYAFDLDDNVLESLQIKKENEVVVLTIVTLKKSFNASTLNLQAPLIINSSNRKGKQYILNTDDHPTKAPIAPVNSATVKGD